MKKNEAGTVVLIRMPVRGFVLAAGRKYSSYHETGEEAKATVLAVIAWGVDLGGAAEDGFSITLLTTINTKGWGYVSPKQPNIMGITRIRNAYLCSFGEGLIVCSDLESVGLMVDEFFEYRYGEPNPLPEREVQEMKDEQAAALAAEDPPPTPPA